MIIKKFITFVLTIGLVVSIGIALSLEEYDTTQVDESNTKQTADKQTEIGIVIPSYGEKTQDKEEWVEDTGIAPVETAPSEEYAGEMEVSPVEMAPLKRPEGAIAAIASMGQSRTFDSYKIISEGDNQDSPVMIECYYHNDLIGYILFRSDVGFRSHPKVELVDSERNIKSITYPMSRLDEILSILRNERPLFFWISEGNIYYGIGTGSLQPVGGS
jgi:hypothetical protein